LKNKIILSVVLVIACLQLKQIDRIPYEKPTEQDIFAMENSNSELEILVKKNCYDCHSNQVNYPWYSSIAPISWFVQDHIEDGRKHMNFSEWGAYSNEKKAHKAEEGSEEVEEGEMPLESYAFIHRHANLSQEQRSMIVNWFAKLESKYIN
jgi:hypothetical protein